MIIDLKAGFKANINNHFRMKALVSTFIKRKINSYRDIPVIVNNYNRLNYLKKLILWLETVGMKNIYIIDNASVYPQLLEFYKQTKYTVFRLNQNVGHTALWDTHIFMLFRDSYYVYTDPDILPVEECPGNAVEYFLHVLEKYPEYTKVGFGLKIDDIPDWYNRKKEVINWESKYWEKPIEKGLYRARIDTTFALYKPKMKYQQWDKTIRTSGIYMARHLPWYVNSSRLGEEEEYFRNIVTNVNTWYSKGVYHG